MFFAYRKGGLGMTFARRTFTRTLMIMLLLCLCMAFGFASAQAQSDPIEFTVEATPTELTAPGDITVSLRVSNTGDTDMRDPVTLLDPSGNVVSSFGDNGSIVLLAGKYLSWSGSYAVTEEDLDNGQITYTIQYNLEDEDGNIAACTQQGAIPLSYTGERVRLVLNRTLEPEVVRQGNTAAVIYEVANNGNVTLSSIKVKEELTGRTQTIDELEPGDSEKLTFSTRMGNADLKSAASVTYKAEGSDETLTASVEEVIIPLAKPNLTVSLEAVGDVNIGESATLRMTFVNAGNVSYRNVTVRDEEMGDVFSGLEIPAGATVTHDKQFTLTEPTEFKFTAECEDNTGETREVSTNKVRVQVFDPEKSLRLNLNLTSDTESITEAPAIVHFTLQVTNDSNVKAEDIVIRHGEVRMYTIAELDAGESVMLEWDVNASQAGQFRFTAHAEDELGNDVSFDSNTYQLTYTMPTSAPTAAPVVTVAPLVTLGMPTEDDVSPVISGARDTFLTLAVIIGILFLGCLGLFIASTVIRAKNRRLSENAYDHLELAGSRDYTEEKTETLDDTVQTEEIVEEEDDLTPVWTETTEEAPVENAEESVAIPEEETAEETLPETVEAPAEENQPVQAPDTEEAPVQEAAEDVLPEEMPAAAVPEEAPVILPEETDLPDVQMAALPHEKLLQDLNDDPGAPEPELTAQDVLDYKVKEREPADDPYAEIGFHVSRTDAPAFKSAEPDDEVTEKPQPRRRRAARSKERTQDGE